jgi:dTMP kinase
MKSMFAGNFIVIDGPDGCGKTTQTKLLAAWLKDQGVDIAVFRDPGDTAVGEMIRDILLNPENIWMDTTTEVMLHMSARARLWFEKIAPALKENKCVVLDRWLSSTCAYQGCAGGFGADNVIKIAQDCLERPWPDLTIILDLDLATAAKRLNRRLDRMEQKGDGYHQKVRQGFLELAKNHKDFVILDASADIDTTHQRIIKIIEEAFRRS